MTRVVAAAVTAAAVVWAAALLAAPFQLAHGFSSIAFLIYESASLICHQRAERSFHLAGVQLPVCARCLGIYSSGAVGAVAAWLQPPGRDAGARLSKVVLAWTALPTVLTLAVEWLGLAHPSNALRACAAIPLGLSAAWWCVRALRTEERSRALAEQMRYHA